MTVTFTTPAEILDQAANAAAKMIPALEEEIEQKREELATLVAEAEQLRVLAQRVQHQSNVALAKQPAAQKLPNAVEDIENVLVATDLIAVPELRKTMLDRFGNNWAESTIYNHLKKGKDSGRYINESNRWGLSGAAKVARL